METAEMERSREGEREKKKAFRTSVRDRFGCCCGGGGGPTSNLLFWRSITTRAGLLGTGNAVCNS